jgi:dihydrofolate reductase
MPCRVEGFAIVSDDGMLADAAGVMPSALVVEADQQFLSDSLDRVDLIVHGRNSHENQENSPRRRRLIATRQIKTFAPAEKFGHALFWNPAGFPLEKAAELLGVRDGTVAILGGTQIYDLFLRRYDVFHLSRLVGLRLQAGHPVFSQVPKLKPEAVLASSGLIPGPQRLLDGARGVTMTSWQKDDDKRTRSLVRSSEHAAGSHYRHT